MLSFKYLKSDPSTYIMQYKNGKLKKSGTGLSFLYFAPTTSLVSVPTGSREIPFIFKEVTSDYQEVSVQGSLVYKISQPEELASQMNYTLSADAESYISDDPEKLKDRLINLVQVSIKTKIQGLKLRAAISATSIIAEEVKLLLTDSSSIQSLGLEVIDFTIQAIKPTPETSRALETEVRESLLQEADEAIFVRRNAAIEQERAIKESELKTELTIEERQQEIQAAKLEAKKIAQEKERSMKQAEMQGRIEIETKRSELVDESTDNSRKEAQAKAYAMEEMVKALSQLDVKIMEAITMSGMAPDQLVAQAFKELAAGAGKIGELNISPDLLQQLMGDKK